MQEVLALSPSPVVIGGVSCNSGEKDGVAAPPVGTRVSCFERSLLEPNLARLAPGPEGYSITHLTPVLWWPMAFSGLERGALCILCIPPLAFSAYHLVVPSHGLCIRAYPWGTGLGLTELACFAYHLWWTDLGLTGLYPLSAVWVRPARRQCKSGGKDGVLAPPVGTRVSFFERSLLGPNSARLSSGPEGNSY